MRHNIIETVVAGVVVLIAGAFLFFALSETQPKTIAGYELTANFDNGTDLRAGAEVQIAGVPVGRVLAVELNETFYEVDVTLLIRQEVALPADTRARITSDGLMGGGIVLLEPGRAEARLAAGDRIFDTESPVNIVDQFGRFIYSGGGGGGGPEEPFDDF